MAGLDKADAITKILADFDGDGKVTAEDARKILKKVAKILDD